MVKPARTAHRSMANPDVAVLLAAARRARGLTIARAADLAGISAGMVSMLEHGRPRPPVVVAEVLADVYGMAPGTRELLMAEAFEGVGRDSPFYRTRMLRRRS
jgi:transcriptional regulator with XRE-family HTH domain